jgi:hypothetical protein
MLSIQRGTFMLISNEYEVSISKCLPKYPEMHS